MAGREIGGQGTMVYRSLGSTVAQPSALGVGYSPADRLAL
jgi:hypothetical protein